MNATMENMGYLALRRTACRLYVQKRFNQLSFSGTLIYPSKRTKLNYAYLRDNYFEIFNPKLKLPKDAHRVGELLLYGFLDSFVGVIYINDTSIVIRR